MRQSPTSLEQLFDRTWRPGQPFRPRVSGLRRWGMMAVLLVLLTLIGGYWYLTDSIRVKHMCETYLTRLIGGRVEVGHASLSIFEGLRLEKVRLLVDEGHEPDATLFEVGSVSLKYNPESILSGNLEATEIVAIDPVVWLCENVETGKWNYQRMILPQRPATTQGPGKPMVLPQIKLRNGLIRYSRMQAGSMQELGTMAIDGNVTPGDAPGKYVYRIQSRSGGSDVLGPVVTGELAPGSGIIAAKMRNFVFGPDVEAVLPDQVRQWLIDHMIAGPVDLDLYIVRSGAGGKPTFKAVVEPQRVQLAVDPNEWFSRVEQQQMQTLRGAFDLMRFAGLNGQMPQDPSADVRPNATPAGGFVDALQTTVLPAPVMLQGVRGNLTFTQDGIALNVTGSVEQNDFHVSGEIHGYSPASPATLEISGSGLIVPRFPRFINSMPRIVRDIYQGLRPEGACDLWVKIDRQEAGQRPIVQGQVDLLEGSFQNEEFPYWLRNVTGQIVFGPDPQYGEKLLIKNIRGYGVAGGPNQDHFVTINGTVAPLSGDAEVNIQVVGDHIASEPAIRAALPKDAREALKTLDPSGKGDYPTFKGHISALVHRDPGPYKPYGVTLTMDLEDAAGTFEGFAYPLENITGHLVIGDHFVRLQHCTARRLDADVALDGALTWETGQPVKPDLAISAHNIPIDGTLLAALSASQRSWLQKIGLGGKLDVEGKISHPVAATRPSDVDVTLDMAVRQGSLLPENSTFAVSDLSGKLHMANGRLLMQDFKGKRLAAPITAQGVATWAEDQPDLSISATAKDLLLEPALYQVLPKGAQEQWDAVQPQGTVDVDLRYGKEITATTQPTTMPSTSPYAVTLTPRNLAVNLKAMPYRLTDLSGQIDITAAGAELKNIYAQHDKAKLTISGGDAGADPSAWLLHVVGRDLPVDDELRQALPASLVTMIKATKLRGAVSFDFPKLMYRPNHVIESDAATAPAMRGTGNPDVDLQGMVWLTNASIDVGVPITDINAVLKLDASVSNGKLGRLRGKIEAPAIKVSDRPMRDFSAELFKPEKQDGLRLEKIQALMAGGEMAGQMDLVWPDNSPSRYALSLVLRNADVQQLTGEKDQIKGQLNASLSMEGAWDDPRTRRGRGDVTVAGKDMYRIPLVLGLLQITNLALPISSPFSEANARYTLDGPKLTFDQIELRASNMLMQGSGSLNFDTKKVNMTFTTDNPNWPKVPIFSELLNGAKHELLQIKVNGTVQEPRVTGSMMNTFTTTVDEVFKANENNDDSDNTYTPRHK